MTFDWIKFAQGNEPRILGRAEDWEPSSEDRLEKILEFCRNELAHIDESIESADKERQAAMEGECPNKYGIDIYSGQYSFYCGFKAALKSVLEK